MKRLAETFDGRGEVRGHVFTKVRESSKAYIYHVQITPNLEVYEVFKHKENAQYDCVSYPTSKAFGIWAWSIEDKTRAFAKFEELNQKQAT